MLQKHRPIGTTSSPSFWPDSKPYAECATGDYTTQKFWMIRLFALPNVLWDPRRYGLVFGLTSRGMHGVLPFFIAKVGTSHVLRDGQVARVRVFRGVFYRLLSGERARAWTILKVVRLLDWVERRVRSERGWLALCGFKVRERCCGDAETFDLPPDVDRCPIQLSWKHGKFDFYLSLSINNFLCHLVMLGQCTVCAVEIVKESWPCHDCVCVVKAAISHAHLGPMLKNQALQWNSDLRKIVLHSQ